MGTLQPPPWQALHAENYNARMKAKSDALMADILASASQRNAILTDPAALHAELFADFTPEGYAEYAGTYRGTPGTSLTGRISGAPSVLTGDAYPLAHPDDVGRLMTRYLSDLNVFRRRASDDHTANLGDLAYAFAQFGYIHPFLDGNGHVQRALFAALATEFGYPISSRFAIHPRPFDALLAIALERFSKAMPYELPHRIGEIMEYLGFFLDGPFNAPGMNLLPEY